MPDAIEPCELPGTALLRHYRELGAYADCYSTEITGTVSQAEYIAAFYTTWVFKLERRLLGWFVAKPSTDRQAHALAAGETDAFAAWSVEDRRADQLLMCDYQKRTRSWLMSVATANGTAAGTRFYFGSAVVPVISRRSGKKTMGPVFAILLGFHRIYSHVLLRAAVSRLLRARRSVA